MNWQVHVDVTRDGDPLLRATFDRSPITLGARPDNDVVLGDPHVSGRHAVVMVSRGALLVQDQSRNGCFVDERRIEGQHELGRRGRVHIPPFAVELVFESDDNAEWHTVQSDVDEVRAAAEARGIESRLEPDPELADLSLVHPAESPAAEPAAAAEPPKSRRSSKATIEIDALDEGALVELVVTGGPERLRERRFPLPDEDAIELGRGDDARIRIPDRTVSRLHAVITRRDGRFRISDLDSANGVLVNGERVRFAPLQNGDVLTLGQVALTFRGPAGIDPPADSATRDDPVTPSPRGPLDALDIHVRPLDETSGAMLIDVRGPVDGYNDHQLARAFERVVREGARAIVVDLEGVSYLGHTAFGILVGALEELEQREGRLILAGAGQQVREAMALSGLDQRFASHMLPDRARALVALRG